MCGGGGGGFTSTVLSRRNLTSNGTVPRDDPAVPLSSVPWVFCIDKILSHPIRDSTGSFLINEQSPVPWDLSRDNFNCVSKHYVYR